jgi:Ig domain of plant-specific actin-binding protein
MKGAFPLSRVGALALVAIAVVTVVAAAATDAAVQTAPTATGEPSITGTPRVGAVLRASRGSWTGTTPMTFSYRWFRCEGRGLPDASDCARITNAADNTYVARQADAGFRLRVRVTATNVDGSATSTSNPTDVIQSARPVNTTEPSISGTATVGSRLTANRGTWVGEQPITYSFQWLRCNAAGDNCAEIVGATDTTYVVTQNDVGRSLRVRVTARNDAGSRSALSNPRAVTQQPQPPPASFVDVQGLRAAGDRLVVSQVQFSPNPVTSRTSPIVARVKVANRDGRAVRGAQVFMRATPRVARGDIRPTAADGWVTLTLVPNQYFPQPRDNFNVQFFVKAYRAGDPPLGGIAGYRLVQVRLAAG